MVMLLSAILTIVIVWWFYQTAEKRHAKSFQWAVAGALSYLLPAWAWMLLVSKPYLASLQGPASRMTTSAWLISHSWIVAGAVVTLLVYKFALSKSNVKSD